MGHCWNITEMKCCFDLWNLTLAYLFYIVTDTLSTLTATQFDVSWYVVMIVLQNAEYVIYVFIVSMYSVFFRFHISLKFAIGQTVQSASFNWLINASTRSISTLRHLGFAIQEMFIQYNYIPSLFTYIAHRFIRYSCKTRIQPIKPHFNGADVLPYMASFSNNHIIIWKTNESVKIIAVYIDMNCVIMNICQNRL